MRKAAYLNGATKSPASAHAPACRTRSLTASAGALSMIMFELVTSPWRRKKRLEWGTVGDESGRELPGDDIVDPAAWQYTHAISIGAEPEQVWPWLVQIGQGRGGFYSYVALENLFGCRIDDVGEIVPELQYLQVGDSIRLHPKAPPMPVQIVEPGRALVLGGMVGLNTGSSWALVLVRDGPRACRLLARGRSSYGSLFTERLFFGRAIMEPATFVMERRMLRTIKMLAESTVAGGPRRGTTEVAIPRSGVLGVDHALAMAGSPQR